MVQQLRLPSLLIALPKLLDQNFHRAVILLIEHNKDGALGYIINKPLPASERDAAFQKRYKIPAHIPVWGGGPLGSHQGIVLHNQAQDPNAIVAFDNLRISTSEEAVDGLIKQIDIEIQQEIAAKSGRPRPPAGLHPYRFVIGSAGWGPKQLEMELKAGTWMQQPLDEKLVFDTPWQEIWVRAIDKLGVEILNVVPTSQSYIN